MGASSHCSTRARSRCSRSLAAVVLFAGLTLVACSPPPPLPDPVPAEAVVHRGVRFADRPSGPLLADLYLPADGHADRVIIFVHGGGFVEGDRSDLTRHTPELLDQLVRGYAVMTIDYRLEPFPAAVLDLDDAVKWVRSSSATDLGIAPGQVVVAGHSVGGTIAAVAALGRGTDSRFASLDSIDGWMAIAAPTDLSDSAQGGTALRHSWGADGQIAASPVNLISADDPPGLLIHGDQDLIVSDWHSLNFAQLANAVSPSLVTIEHVKTGSADCRGHAPLCGASTTAIDSFLDGLTTGSPST